MSDGAAPAARLSEVPFDGQAALAAAGRAIIVSDAAGIILSWNREAEHLYGWAEGSEFASPFVVDAAKRSPVVATIDLSAAIDAAAVAAVLRANGIVDTEPYRKLGRNQLRIGMFPGIETSDLQALTASIDWLIGNYDGVRA